MKSHVYIPIIAPVKKLVPYTRECEIYLLIPVLTIAMRNSKFYQIFVIFIVYSCRWFNNVQTIFMAILRPIILEFITGRDWQSADTVMFPLRFSNNSVLFLFCYQLHYNLKAYEWHVV